MLRRDSTQRSFFDQTLYDRLIESDHFLRRLDAIIDFGFVHRICRDCYAREVGVPPENSSQLNPVIYYCKNHLVSSQELSSSQWKLRTRAGQASGIVRSGNFTRNSVVRLG